MLQLDDGCQTSVASSSDSYVREIDGREMNPLMSAFLELRPALRAYIVKRVRTPQDAEDLLQDMASKVLTAPDNSIANQQAYLFSVASNLLKDWRRRHVLRDGVEQIAIYDFDFADDAALPSTVLDGRQRLGRLQRGLRRLPPDMRQAFVLNRIQGLTLAATAEETDLSVARVRKLVERALTRLSIYVWRD